MGGRVQPPQISLVKIERNKGYFCCAKLHIDRVLDVGTTIIEC